MAQGINGDLADITVYTDTTPVHYSTSNVPLTELDSNILILDTKLEGYIESGTVALSEAGDGSYTYPVVLTTTANTAPRVMLGLDSLSCFSSCSVLLATSSVTTGGFTVNLKIAGSGGAWTGNLYWLSDGR